MAQTNSESAAAAAAPAVQAPTLRGSRRFLYGGLGALLPVLVAVSVLDGTVIETYMTEAGWYKMVGYVLRVAGLFALGGVWAYAHRSVAEPAKLLQLGVVAPAMITAMINAGNLREATADGAGAARPAAVEAPADHGRAGFSPLILTSFSLTSQAHAQPLVVKGRDDPKDDADSPVEQIIKGLLGRR